jgi:hypothetical protein
MVRPGSALLLMGVLATRLALCADITVCVNNTYLALRAAENFDPSVGAASADGRFLFGELLSTWSGSPRSWRDYGGTSPSAHYDARPMVTRVPLANADVNFGAIGKDTVDPADPDAALLVSPRRRSGGWRVATGVRFEPPIPSSSNYLVTATVTARRDPFSRWGSSCVSADGAELHVGVGGAELEIPLPATGNATVSVAGFDTLTMPTTRFYAAINPVNNKDCDDFILTVTLDARETDCSSAAPRLDADFAGNATGGHRFVIFDVTAKADLLFFELAVAFKTTGTKTYDVFYAPGMSSAAASNARVNYQHLYKCNNLGVPSSPGTPRICGAPRSSATLLRAGVTYAFAIATAGGDDVLHVSSATTPPGPFSLDTADLSIGLGRYRTDNWGKGSWGALPVAFHGAVRYALGGIAQCLLAPPTQTCTVLPEAVPIALDVKPPETSQVWEESNSAVVCRVRLTAEPSASVFVTASDMSDSSSITVREAVFRFTPQNWDTYQSATANRNGDNGVPTDRGPPQHHGVPRPAHK